MYTEVIFGMGVGFNYATSLKNEAAFKQGENDYQASLCQIQEISNFASVACNVMSKVPYSPVQMGGTIGNVVLPLTGFVLMPTSALIKNGHYEQGASCFGAYFPRLKGILPETIEEKSVNAFSFLADNTSKITNVGLAVSLLVLPFMGFGSVAVGIGAPIAYRALESANLIPTKMSSWVEKYMPTLVNASMIATGGPISKLIALGTLSSNLPGVSDYTQKTIESVFSKKIYGAALEEIDGPWLQKNDLSYENILFILENEDASCYKINPAHCSKQAELRLDLSKDYDFDGFLKFFYQVKWKERYSTLKSAFRDDDRFRKQELKNKFGKQDFKKDFELYIDKWAAETGISKEQFLAEKLMFQMHDFVLILKKEKPVEGNALDLEDAIESCSSILAYLNNEPSIIEMEDILIKLAIEGGNYCALGIKRAAKEILSGIIIPESDPQKAYELIIRSRLQNIRQKIMQNAYLKMVETMTRLAKEGEGVYVSQFNQTTDEHAVAIAQDVHTMDFYQKYLALGFYPLTENERATFGVADFISWTMYSPFRDKMYHLYHQALDTAIHDHGELYFNLYIVNKIKELSIQQDEKDLLIEKIALCEEGLKTMKSFRRLFFVMQGILNVNLPLISNAVFEKELLEWESV